MSFDVVYVLKELLVFELLRLVRILVGCLCCFGFTRLMYMAGGLLAFLDVGFCALFLLGWLMWFMSLRIYPPAASLVVCTRPSNQWNGKPCSGLEQYLSSSKACYSELQYHFWTWFILLSTRLRNL